MGKRRHGPMPGESRPPKERPVCAALKKALGWVAGNITPDYGDQAGHNCKQFCPKQGCMIQKGKSSDILPQI